METHVSFEGDSQIYVVDQYSNLLGPCRWDCPMDHDHFKEAHVCVRKQSWTSMPLSKLKHIFDPTTHVGREATQLERTPL